MAWHGMCNACMTKSPIISVSDCVMCMHTYFFMIGKLSWFICYPLTRFSPYFNLVLNAIVATVAVHCRCFLVYMLYRCRKSRAFSVLRYILSFVIGISSSGYFTNTFAPKCDHLLRSTFYVIVKIMKLWFSKIFIKCQNVTFMKIAR